MNKRFIWIAWGMVTLVVSLWAAGKRPDRPVLPGGRVPSTDPPVRLEEKAFHPSGRVDSGFPVYLMELENPHDFMLFANGGGWDGNWYVGYNTCWVSKLPPAPPGHYVRAYLGAKLGRMKTEKIPGRPSWEKRPIPGQIEIALAQEPLWPQSRRFVLTDTEYIPLEGDTENAVEGVGESRWFWIEVPVRFVSSETDNYVALYSPTKALSDSRHAPVLAAGWGDTRQNSWLNSTVKGEPPFAREEALKTAVTYFEPAIAIKLVRAASGRPPAITILDALDKKVELDDKMILTASVSGEDIQGAWIEFSTDTKVWRQAGPLLPSAPYTFTLKRDHLLEGLNYVRVAAVDVFENKGLGPTFSVFVSPAGSGKKNSR